MTRTSFMLPDDLHTKARIVARKRGVSLGEFIRDSIRRGVKSTSEGGKDLLFDLDVFDGPAPADSSVNHDRYLYGSRKRK